MSLANIGAGILVIGGIINAVPPIASKLSEITGGKPVFHVLGGILSAAVGVALISNVF